MTKLIRRQVLAIAAAFALLPAMSLATPVAAAPADLKAQIDAYLATAWPADGPGVAVIVTQGGKTVYEGGRGLADVANKAPVTPATVFRIGSITKQFSAAVILQLVAEGKLSLDDPLSKFVPGYPAPGGAATVRQLLNHTVGVQSYTGIPGWMVEANTARAFTTTEMIAQFRDRPSPFQPGQDWSYNNSGYVLAGAVIEAVTGKPWHVAVAERFAGPLKLATLRYGEDAGSVTGMATPYTAGGAPAQKIHMSVPHAAGALVGSVRDLALWSAALHHGKVVGTTNYAAMIAPTRLPDGRSIPYGLGIGNGEVRGVPTIGHGGGIFGGSTDSLYVPGKDMFVAVFANSDAPATAPSMAIRRIIALALGNPFPVFTPVAVDPATLAPLFGVYAADDGKAERRFFTRGGKLYALRSGGTESEVFATGGDRFFYGPNSLNWFFVRREAAGSHVMEMHQNGAEDATKMTRKGPIPEAPR